MARKKHLKNISKEDMEIINQKMSYQVDYERTYYTKSEWRGLSFKLNVKCKNEKQKEYFNNLIDLEKKINICNAPAGVGKSYLALAAGLQCLKRCDVESITIIVPTVEASEACKIGLLPGTIDEKLEPYKMATMSNLEKILRNSGNEDYKNYVGYLMKSGRIKFDLLSYARGRNFDDTFIILDEAENLSEKECLLLLTRLGEGNSKVVLIGDEQQCDRRDLNRCGDCGLTKAIEKLSGVEGVTINEFETEDIVRNDFLTRLLDAWNS